MAALYQRPRGRHAGSPGPRRARGLLAALALAGCSTPPADPPPRSAAAPRRDSLAAFFETFTIAPAGAAGAGRVLGTRTSGAGTTAVLLGPEPARIEPVLPGESRPSRALAWLGGERGLIELASGPADGETRWVLAGPAGSRRVLGPPPGERWRFLVAIAGRPALLAAATSALGGNESLLELGLGGERRAVATAAPGFRFAAAAADGARAALVRDLDDRSSELVLYDRASGEMRLLLPDADEGRFRPLAFSPDGARLLLLTDDASDPPRAEWLDLADRSRAPIDAEGCAALDARLGADGSLALELSCGGPTRLRWLDAASGAPRQLPEAPAGARLLALWPPAAGGPELWAVGGARWPRDLWRRDADGEARPLTYGLAAGIDAADLVDSELVELRSAAGPLPAELWRPRRAAGGAPPGALIWLEDDVRPPRWQEHEPLFQYLAERGVAVMRLRTSGSDGFGRRYRARADGRQGELELTEVELARRALVESAGVDPARVALVGAGAWPGAIAGAAARAESHFARVVAIDPAPDPLALLESAAELAPGEAARARARFGELGAPELARRRALLRLGAAPPRSPFALVVDGATPAGAAARAALGAGGAEVDFLDLATPPLGAPRLDARLGAALAEWLRLLHARPPAPPAPR